MDIFAGVMTLLVCLFGLACVVRYRLIQDELRRGFRLTEGYGGPGANVPYISVIVAARNEAANIEACVRTMLKQDYPKFEMIVCNDRSTDTTGAIVKRLADEDERIRLINVKDLPAGWCGKNHAMQIGIAASKGQWLCMIDADCRQTSRRTLSVALQYAQDRGSDLLSILPVIEMCSFWERVVQPVCAWIMMAWFRPSQVNKSRSSTAYANGAFMLMKRSMYEQVGTHKAVRGRMVEDMELARLVKGSGGTVSVVRNGGLYVVRMYTCLREIISGWSRIFLGAFGSLAKLSISLVLVTLMGLLPYAAAGVGFALAATGIGSRAWLICGVAGLVVAVLQMSVTNRFYKLVGERAGPIWTFPLGCIISVVVLIVCLTKLRPGARLVWRDTKYSAVQRI